MSHIRQARRKKLRGREKRTFLTRGVASVEFALTLAVIWLPLLLGVADGTYFLITNERVDRIATTVADIVSQYQTNVPAQTTTYLTQGTLNDIMMAAGQLTKPISFNPGSLGSRVDGSYPTATGYIIVTSIYQDPTQGPIVKWQYSCAPANSLPNVAGVCPPSGNGIELPGSRVGSSLQGSPATLPNGMTINAKENVIVAEVFYTFSPLFLGPFLPQTIYRAMVYKPRLGSLIAAPT